MLIRMLLKAFPEKNNALRVSHKVFKKEKKKKKTTRRRQLVDR